MIAIGRNVTGVTLGLLGLASFTVLMFGLVFLKLSPLLVGALLVGGLIVSVSAFRPYIGVHVILGLMFFEGVMKVAQDVTVTKILGGLITAGWLASSLAQRRLRRALNVYVMPVFAYLAWCTLAAVRAVDTDLAMNRLLSYVLLAMSVVMIGSVVDTPERLRGLLFALACWTTLSALIALVMYYAGSTRVAVGLMGNRNELAMYINMGAIAALLVYPLLRGVVPRLMLMAGIPVLMLALALTLSRTGLIVMLLTLLTVWYRLARERGFLLLLGSTLACAALAFLLPGAFWARASTILPSIERQEDTFGMRVRLWGTGLRLVEERPLTGVGPGNFMQASSRYASGKLAMMHLNSHNTYVGTAAETGLVGLALFLLAIASIVTAVRRAAHAARQAGLSELALEGVTVETMLLAVLLTGITMNVEGLKAFWIGLGMCVAFVGIVRNTTQDFVPAPETVPEVAGEAAAT
jgi:O-antigen ligase